MINWEVERRAIAAVAAVRRVDPDFIEAIRIAQDGDDAHPFGYSCERAADYASQLEQACRDLARLLADCSCNPLVMVNGKCRYSRAFVAWFARKWALPREGDTREGLATLWLSRAWGAYQARINRG